tara:strand:+ start:563 stop:676 length:114 start_codon:yes stop_codon:yes gene_type:complete
MIRFILSKEILNYIKKGSDINRRLFQPFSKKFLEIIS